MRDIALWRSMRFLYRWLHGEIAITGRIEFRTKTYGRNWYSESCFQSFVLHRTFNGGKACTVVRV